MVTKITLGDKLFVGSNGSWEMDSGHVWLRGVPFSTSDPMPWCDLARALDMIEHMIREGAA